MQDQTLASTMDALTATQTSEAQEYNLCWSILQDPELLWSDEAAAMGGQLQNCLLTTHDRRLLLACGLDRVNVISLSDGSAQEVLLSCCCFCFRMMHFIVYLSGEICASVHLFLYPFVMHGNQPFFFLFF